jgi:hypothetical protein
MATSSSQEQDVQGEVLKKGKPREQKASIIMADI